MLVEFDFPFIKNFRKGYLLFEILVPKIDLETLILRLEDTPRGALRRLLTYVLIFSNSKTKNLSQFFLILLIWKQSKKLICI